MRKIFFLFFLLMFAGMVFAQTSVAQKSKVSTERQRIIAKIEKTVEAAQVYDFLRKCASKIDKGKPDGKPLTPIDYHSFKSKIKEWLDYRWFIADTGLSRKWLKSVHELITYMAKTKSYIDSAKFSGNTKTAKYLQAVKYFDTAYKRFVKLAKKPVKVSLKSVRNAKVKKVLWQKAMRKKYKIKEKIQAEF